MNKGITAMVFPLIAGTIFARNSTEDEASINKQIDAMISSWNNHNYDDIENYTMESTDWVNMVGLWWKTCEES